MRFSIPGARRRRAPTGGAACPPALTTVRVGMPRRARSLGRREVDLVYDRVFVPSLVIDHTELMLRQHGVAGAEGLRLWGGTRAATTRLSPRW